MKFKIFSFSFALAALSLLASCDDWQPDAGSQFVDGTGGLLSGTLNVEVVGEPVKAQGRADGRQTVDTSSFTVYITAKGSTDIVMYDKNECRWIYSDMPEIITLPVGNYTIHVISHEPEPVAWSAPYFEGSTDFTVENSKVINIGTVKCLFRSLKIAVKFDKSFVDLMDPDKSKVTVVAGKNGTSAEWTAAETRYAYFKIDKDNPTVVARFNGVINGQSYTVNKSVNNAEAGDYFIFSFSLNQGDLTLPDSEGEVHASGVNIDVETIKSKIEEGLTPGEDPAGSSEKHPNAEEWPDPVDPGIDPDDPTPPTPSDTGVTLAPLAGFNADGINDVDDNMDYVFMFNTESPISDVTVDIDSPDYLTKPNGDSNMLKDVGLDSHFSLAYPGEFEEGLSGLGFATGDEVTGKTSLEFVLTDLLKLLNTDTGGRHIHKFTITIKTEGRPDYVKTLQFRNQ